MPCSFAPLVLIHLGPLFRECPHLFQECCPTLPSYHLVIVPTKCPFDHPNHMLKNGLFKQDAPAFENVDISNHIFHKSTRIILGPH
jgi:hypothetical protein